MPQVKTSINGREYSVDTADLPESSVVFLLTRGFSEALRNVNAGTTADVLGTKKAPQPKWTAERRKRERDERGLANDQDLFAAIVLEREKEMFDDIMAGTVEARQNGPRRTGYEAILFEVATQGVENMYRRKGLPIDKKAASWKEAIEKAMGNASVIALAKQRHEQESALNLDDLDE